MIDPFHPDYHNTPVSSHRPEFTYFPATKNQDPAVSVITPFYNTGEEFHETALSLMRQSLQQWEWIIINDGSSDGHSVQILDRYRHRDPRIRVLDCFQNRGPSAARNKGFLEARAEIVVLLDSDDLLEPTALEKWAWFLQSHPECAFVSGYSVGFGATQYLWSDGFHSGPEILQRNTLRVTAALRKSTHASVGGFSEDMRTGLEDWQFWLRCAEKGYWGDTLPEYLDWYRRRKDHGDRWVDYGQNETHQVASLQLQSQFAHLRNSFPKPLPKPLEIYPQIPEEIPFKNPLRKEKRRILMLIPWMTMGGADKFNLDLLSQLSARDWEITIVATLPGDNCWQPRFAEITPDIFILDHFLTLTDWPRFIRYIIDSRGIDHVLISNSDFGYSVLPYLKQQFPSVVFTDYCHMEEEYWKSGGYPRKAVENQPLLDMNIVSSEHLKNWMIQRGAEGDRISVCYTNIDSAEWQPRKEMSPSVRQELGIAPDVPIILYAGRIHPQKQPRVFAETVLRLKDSGLSFAAVVAGDGPEFSWLQDFTLTHSLKPWVKLLGALPNEKIKRLLEAADIFFLPSKMEGISLAIYEAMACGVAVVGANVGGQSELVTPDCGYLIDRDTESAEVDNYSAILSSLLRDRAKMRQMGGSGRNRIVNHFRLTDMGARMHALLESAAEWSRTKSRLPVNPGLGQSLLSMAIDYHRIEKLLRDVWPFYMWAQRNRSHLEILFPSDKVPQAPSTASSTPERPLLNSLQNGTSSSPAIEESIYNLFAHLPERVLQAYLGEDTPVNSPLLEDLLTMRRRIMPEIERWTEQGKRIAIYGIGTQTQAMLGSIPNLMPLVRCFIDRRASGTFLGRPCIQTESLNPADIDVVIYSSKRWEREMYRNLCGFTSIEHVLLFGTDAGVRVLDSGIEIRNLTQKLQKIPSPASRAPQPTSVSTETHAGRISDPELKTLLNLLLSDIGFRKIQELGFHLQTKDYYSPLNDCAFLETNPDLWNTPGIPEAIDWRLDAQLELAREISKYLDELKDVPENPPSDCSAFGWNNNFWNTADALVQYGLVRSRKPHRYIEVGCGWSSLLLKKALDQNAAQGAHSDVTLVEPYPNPAIFQHLPAQWKIHKTILQRADLSLFDQLQAGDFLFYDGSHCSKTGSDVNWFFFKVLPRLKPGVLIHLHDIFLPEDYPAGWIFERGQTWNEQHLLQAFLMNNSSYSVLIGNRFLFLHHQVELEKLYKGLQPAFGCSFWMQKISN